MYLGIEATYQASLKIILLLLSQTKTPTTGGFDSFFQKNSFLGFPVNPIDFLTISLFITLFSTVMKNVKIISMEKGGFLRIKPKLLVATYTCFSSIRKVASIVAFFTPSLGLFSLLHHWQYETIPFKVRLNQAFRTNNNQDYLNNVKIELFNMTEEIPWRSLDHWTYENHQKPKPPPYSIYTGLSLQHSFFAYVGLLILQKIVILLVKIATSDEFNEKRNYLVKITHIIHQSNALMPYKDWDTKETKSVKTLKERFKNIEKEMCCTLATNFIFTLLMMLPLFVTGK